MNVLFDLDLTLINSMAAEPLRRQRRWKQVYTLIPSLLPYPGINELLTELHELDTMLCIVTSAPRPYCQRVIHQWGWPIAATVCYHDTQAHKPNPAPFQKGLSRLEASSSHAISVGDSASDIIASKRADICSVAALWGAINHTELLLAKPAFVCESVADLRKLLLSQISSLGGG